MPYYPQYVKRIRTEIFSSDIGSKSTPNNQRIELLEALLKSLGISDQRVIDQIPRLLYVYDSVPDKTKETYPECLDSNIQTVLFSLPSGGISPADFTDSISISSISGSITREITLENLVGLLGEEKSSVEDGELVI